MYGHLRVNFSPCKRTGGEQNMPQGFRYKALCYSSAVLLLATAAKGKKGAATGSTSLNGNWSGELTQVGSQTPYKFELAINAKGVETKYPDLDCTGKLTRVGSSKSYTSYAENITKGQVDKGGPSPDGTVTLARQGNDLALGWFGSVQGTTVI